MSPLLTPHQLVVGSKRRTPHVGDIVTFIHEGREKIKLVARAEADRLYVKGVAESGSTDSDTFGWIPASTITSVIVWPTRRRSRLCLQRLNS